MEMVTVPWDTNERQGGELYMVKKEEGKETLQLTGPEPVTCRSIANPLAVEPWLLPATTLSFIGITMVRRPSPLSISTRNLMLSSARVGVSKDALNRVRPR